MPRPGRGGDHLSANDSHAAVDIGKGRLVLGVGVADGERVPEQLERQGCNEAACVSEIMLGTVNPACTEEDAGLWCVCPPRIKTSLRTAVKCTLVARLRLKKQATKHELLIKKFESA